MRKALLLICLLGLLLSACGVSPGESGEAEALSNLSMFFESQQQAAAYLAQFTTWEAEAEGITVVQPHFTLQDRYLNSQYQGTLVNPTISFTVQPDAEPGVHTVVVTLYTDDRSGSLRLTAKVQVAKPK